MNAITGGAPANVVVVLSKLGRSTAIIGKIGEDQFGEYLTRVLRENGVDTKGLVKEKQANTTLAFVHLKEDGDRTFSFYRNYGADMLLGIDDIDSTDQRYENLSFRLRIYDS